MATERIRYVKTDVVGGAGDGTTIANAYSGIVAAEAAEKLLVANLVAADIHLIFECDGANADVVDNLDFDSGWTTNSTCRITVRPYTGNRAGTTWSTSKYRWNMNTAGVTSLFRDVEILGIQIEDTYTGGSHQLIDFRTGGSNYRKVEGNYFKYSGANGTQNYALYWSSDVGAYIGNNIFEGFPNSAIRNIRASATSYIYNNTFKNCGTAISYTSTATPIAKNNLFTGCTTDCSGTFGAGTDYNSTNNASIGYTVTGGGNTHDRTSQTFTFSSGLDLSSSDTGAYALGVNLSGDASYSITNDIAGNLRSVWSIGADDVLAAYPVIGTITSSVQPGGVINVTGSNLHLATSFTVGGAAQTISSATSTTLNINSFSQGNCKFGSVTATVSDGTTPNNAPITVAVPTGNNYVTVASALIDDATQYSLFDSLPGGAPAVANGDQLQWTDASNVTVNANGTAVVPDTPVPYTFQARRWSTSAGTWGDWETITVSAGGGDLTAPTITVTSISTDDTTPLITGTINDNTATIDVVVVNGTSGTGTNNANGTWQFQVSSALPPGAYAITVQATDSSDNVGNGSGTLTINEPPTISPPISRIVVRGVAASITREIIR